MAFGDQHLANGIMNGGQKIYGVSDIVYGEGIL